MTGMTLPYWAPKSKVMNTIINIGRQFGSGGKSVAIEIGRRLGIPVYDNELITKVAEETGFGKEIFAKRDENRSMFSISSFFVSGTYVNAENTLDENALFKMQSDVIRSIADKGPAIFIGRCSDYILRDRQCLDVFITAPEAERIRRVSARDGISMEQAAALIRKKNRSRESYYNYFTFGNWGVASNYDLCVDSSLLGVEGTAELIMEMARKMGILE